MLKIESPALKNMQTKNISNKKAILNKLQGEGDRKKSGGTHLQQRQAQKIISTAIKENKIDFKDQGFEKLNAENTIAECQRRLESGIDAILGNAAEAYKDKSVERKINQMKKKAVLDNVRLSRAQINAAEHRFKRMNSSDSFKTETDMDKVSEENIGSISSLDDLAIDHSPGKRRGGLNRMVSLSNNFFDSYKISRLNFSLISSIYRTFSLIENLNLTQSMAPRNLRKVTRVVTWSTKLKTLSQYKCLKML